MPKDGNTRTRLVVRIWRTKIDERRAPEYERFARERSEPMFRAHDGFAGVLFCRSGQDCAVITLWEGMESVRRLEASRSYAQTVSDIQATRFIIGPSTTELFVIHGGTLEAAVLTALGLGLPAAS